MKWLLVILIFSVLGVGYLVEQSGQNSRKLGQIQNQVSSLQTQLNKEKAEALQSLQEVKRSLHLHMAESSVEDAVKDILDQNYGQADSAVRSALENIRKANPEKKGLTQPGYGRPAIEASSGTGQKSGSQDPLQPE